MAHGTRQKPRILLLSTSYFPLVGGSELAIRNITERLPEYDFDMVTGRYAPDVAIAEQVGNVRVFRAGGRWHRTSFIFPKLLLPFIMAVTAYRLARTHRYALVHAWQASQAGGAAWLLSWFMPRLPFLLTLQEGKDLSAQPWPVRAARNTIIRRADAVTAISGFLAEYARRATSAPVHVIPNGVAVRRFAPPSSAEALAAAHENMGVGPHDRVIVSVSRLVPKNGLSNLIRALPLLRERMSGDAPVLVLIGGGEQESELRALAAGCGVSGAVRFLGGIEHGRLPAYLHAADVFCRPSLSEGLGNAFLEAMAAGVPVVAGIVGGIADFLIDGETGIVCDPRSPQSIAVALHKALTDRPLRERVTERASAMVRERYDWERISSDMGRMYAELIS